MEKIPSANFEIILQKDTYYQNEILGGQIKLTLEEDIEIRPITINLCAYTYYKYKNDGNNRKEEDKFTIIDEKKIIDKVELDLANLLNISTDKEKFASIKPLEGQEDNAYYFPFTFDLTRRLPPTLFYQSKKKNKIEFKIKTYLELLLYGSAIAQKDFILKSSPFSLNSELTFTQSKSIKSMSLFDKGKTTLTCSYEKNYYKYNEPINLTVEIDNLNGKKKIDGFTIKIIHYIEALFEKEYTGNNIMVFNKEKNVIYNKFFKHLVPPKSDKKIAVTVNSATSKSNIDYFNLGINGEFKLPSLYNNNLIRNYYVIKVFVDFDSNFVSNKQLKIKMPIALVHQTLEEFNSGVFRDLEEEMLGIKEVGYYSSSSCSCSPSPKNSSNSVIPQGFDNNSGNVEIEKAKTFNGFEIVDDFEYEDEFLVLEKDK